MNVQTSDSRLSYLDLAKVSAIVFMILVHTMEQFEGKADDTIGFIIEAVLGGFMSAPVFMVAMGVGFACTRQQSPGHFISRGINMLCLGYLLNVVRYLPIFIYEISSGELATKDLIIALIENDIFHFVGFAMILFGLLRKLNLSDVHILIISIVMSLINTAIPMIISGSIALNATAGHFIFIGYPEHTVMCFPLLSWFIFPAFGYWLMNRLKAPGRTESVFKIALIPCLMITIGAVAFEIINDVNMMYVNTMICAYLCIIAALRGMLEKSVVRYVVSS